MLMLNNSTLLSSELVKSGKLQKSIGESLYKVEGEMAVRGHQKDTERVRTLMSSLALLPRTVLARKYFGQVCLL